MALMRHIGLLPIGQSQRFGWAPRCRPSTTRRFERRVVLPREFGRRFFAEGCLIRLPVPPIGSVIIDWPHSLVVRLVDLGPIHLRHGKDLALVEG